MERDWDARAREAPEHYIATAHKTWDPAEFFRSGEINADNEILSDPDIPITGSMLEIGCGAGRMTKALAAIYAEVYAVDISAEMIALAQRNLSGLPNVHLHKNSGADLAHLPDGSLDFAFSYIVFQHIPSREAIASYIREVHRCLKPGGIFKFQVQGDTTIRSESEGSWLGAPISVEEAHALALASDFEPIRTQGEGTQYFWLWFRKPGAAPRIVAPAEPIEVHFSPALVRPGEEYTVRIPDFAGHTIDVRYEFLGSTGVVGRWCALDANGEARIAVPATQPPGRVRVAAVRSRTANSPWRPASAEIRIAPR
ncbi:MAG: methyltransferase domain-containing protein [Acidobacteriota bacterium]|nr:methyltransferase domain-containing protein [Acidobacteriota bacterium]